MTTNKRGQGKRVEQKMTTNKRGQGKRVEQKMCYFYTSKCRGAMITVTNFQAIIFKIAMSKLITAYLRLFLLHEQDGDLHIPC